MGDAAQLLDGLRPAPTARVSRWDGTRFEWFKRLRSPAERGRVGEQLVAAQLRAAGVPVAPRTGPGHDLRASEVAVRIEVKTGTLHDLAEDGTDHTEWLQLRPGSDFTLAALQCVCPAHVHLWLVPAPTVLAHAVGQHGGRGATETKMLAVDPHRPPAWLGPDVAGCPTALALRVAALTGMS